MRSIRFAAGPWEVEVLPEDGARISMLRFEGMSLLTEAPSSFRPPASDFGRYETRPVYGYDDCLPSVDACLYPELQWEVPDHGELCWLPWECETAGNTLTCRVRSRALPLFFERQMAFSESALEWRFRVRNEGGETVPFQHVMHPLMPVRKIRSLVLPSFRGLIAEMGEPPPEMTAGALAGWLLGRPEGTAVMLYLQNAAPGEFAVEFAEGIRLSAWYPVGTFPTLAIWWNNGGYPDEEGIRRFECALEPVAGSISRLDMAFKEGTCQTAEPGETLSWSVIWKVERTSAPI
ncbi:MAG: hypothetical protein KatS3mg024_2111 [Armatimonadota bacterium]|nr:MAG: hypothetical protein KatS3mg024_2111 [Armatimonadota bacterium]